MTVLVEGENGFETEAEVADTFLKRLLGLMFRSGLPLGNALLLDPCSGIHTWFMRFPIDVVYLDRDNTVIKKETVYPWRIGSFVKGAGKILELNKGAARKLKVGKQLVISFVEERRL
ncbi:DUF192 domain-containing protein [Clostridium sp. Marseille-P2415]|uniref:DUF192 domain-containing protein n=1 Tax=Clostridium sp. Marseille-P2415 TaxID=1805471 RepID=UPI0009882FF5|nr:DUF192 domain-containing protein [Clostridium sp. Marseille-P2415]